MDAENKTLGQSIIEHALNDAIEQYYENPSEDSFHLICNQLVRAYVFNLTVICPFEVGEGGAHHKMYTTPDYGNAFVVYTGYDKNPEEKGSMSYGYMSWRTILSKASETWNSTGIVINPYSGHQALVWINHVFARIIIKYAMEDMQRINTEIKQ